MIITRTVTKKVLENLVHETFTQFGNLSSSSLLDSLKLLGFYYATNAGISINIEDLKTPDAKKEYLKNANLEIQHVSKQWEQGFISDSERFQSIIDIWNLATESLKNRIIDYYQNFDPANNLYIMAFSGARGNMSQVRQLVGMRGLMSDQEGKIIDLPIQTNFREGLSSIDYIISSYGARKGIVDTALKTADSGYLTRRLIYIAQDLVIRELNCHSKDGVIILLNKKSDIKNLIGRTLISTKQKNGKQDFSSLNYSLDKKLLKKFQNFAPLTLNIRSSLTCKSLGSICQKCYGWDLAKEKLISLGEAVGIIAAQSIGEPGTQLTMRTFHTGGIFTGENTKQILAPFSGKLLFPTGLKKINYRTNHGINVLKLQEEGYVTLINWQGLQTEIFLTIGSFLYISTSSFLKKGELIAEYSVESFLGGTRRLKPIYAPIEGEIKWKTPVVKVIPYQKKTIHVNQYEDAIWIASGKIFPLPKEINYQFPVSLNKKKSFATLKLITPFKGFIKITENTITLFGQEKNLKIEFLSLVKEIKNCLLKFSPLIKNYQYVDEHTILGIYEIFPICEGRIYSTREKVSTFIKALFLITESDIWKINSDSINNFSFFKKTDQKGIIRAKDSLNPTSKFNRSGLFLKKDGFKMIFQKAVPLFLTRGTILNYKVGDFVSEKNIFGTLINYIQQTEDIVQGLPKIEEIIEARQPKTKSYLAIRPGVFLNKSIYKRARLEAFSRNFHKSSMICTAKESISPGKEVKIAKELKIFLLRITKNQLKKTEHLQFSYLAHSLFSEKEVIVYDKKIFEPFPIPSFYKLIPRNPKNLRYPKSIKNCQFVFLKKQTPITLVKKKKTLSPELLFHKRVVYSLWKPIKQINSFHLYSYKNGEKKKWVDISKKELTVFTNNYKKDYLIKTKKGNYVFLKYLDLISEYKFPKASRILYKPGEFIDIGEPFTEGIIDVHELLDILFQYHSSFDGIMMGCFRSLAKFQLILVNSIQAIYQSQGVNISNKHIEIIVKQMTSKVVMKQSGGTPLLPGELVRIGLIYEIYKSLKSKNQEVSYTIPKYQPILISATASSLNKDGFLSAAGFQETKRILTKAAIEGSCDWLRGLKECIILGRLIPAGSTFLNYKNYLDNVYLFKN
jgi:hypothetical protein